MVRYWKYKDIKLLMSWERWIDNVIRIVKSYVCSDIRIKNSRGRKEKGRFYLEGSKLVRKLKNGI